jgi:hypothetical protein
MDAVNKLNAAVAEMLAQVREVVAFVPNLPGGRNSRQRAKRYRATLAAIRRGVGTPSFLPLFKNPEHRIDTSDVLAHNASYGTGTRG